MTSTDFLRFLSGVVYTVLPSASKIGAFLIFTWIAFLGTFFFYRAYVVAVPEGRKRNYAYLIFFFPTLLYWPSSLGKEAWMIFALGLATYGVARLLAPGERSGWGLFLTTLGLWLTGLVRPHVAGLLAISLAAAYVVRRPPRRLAQLAPIVKVASIVVVMVVALLFVRAAEDFVLTPEGGLTQVVPTLEELSTEERERWIRVHPDGGSITGGSADRSLDGVVPPLPNGSQQRASARDRDGKRIAAPVLPDEDQVVDRGDRECASTTVRDLRVGVRWPVRRRLLALPELRTLGSTTSSGAPLPVRPVHRPAASRHLPAPRVRAP